MTPKEERRAGREVEVLRGVIWHNEHFGEPMPISAFRRDGDISWRSTIRRLADEGFIRYEKIRYSRCHVGMVITERGYVQYAELKRLSVHQPKYRR